MHLEIKITSKNLKNNIKFMCLLIDYSHDSRYSNQCRHI